MILTAAAEIVLVLALLITLWRLSQIGVSNSEAPQASLIFAVLLLALCTIAFTAGIGAVRYYALSPQAPAALISTEFIGFRLDDLHDGLSAFSRSYAMPLYLFASVWLWGRLPLWFAPALLAMAMLPQLGLLSLFTDASLVLMLLALMQSTAARRFVLIALGCLLAVPLSVLLIGNDDLAMACFHLCLAAHFFSYGMAIRKMTSEST